MIKVNISILTAHIGYHSELINHPPIGVTYSLQGLDGKVVFLEELLFKSRHCEKCLFPYGSRSIKDNVPYFSHPKHLIHAHMMPVFQKIPGGR